MFLSSRFEAHLDRGQGDMLDTHDLEDIINVLDGRPGLLSYGAGHAVDEIAALTFVPVGTVKTRLFHARNKLRRFLPVIGDGCKRPNLSRIS